MKELVAAGGSLEETAAQVQGGQLSPAFRGARKGTWIMLAAFPLALITGLLTAFDDVFAVFLFIPVLCFIIGFVRLLYGLFLADKGVPPVKGAASQPQQVAPVMHTQLGTAARSPELPLPGGVPLEGFTPQRMKTAEMVQPPSVTENTTRLLDREADSPAGK